MIGVRREAGCILFVLVGSCAPRASSSKEIARGLASCPPPVAVLVRGAVEPPSGETSKFFADGSVASTKRPSQLANINEAPSPPTIGRIDPKTFDSALAVWRKHACYNLGMQGGDTYVSLAIDGCEVIFETEEEWRQRSPACSSILELLEEQVSRDVSTTATRCLP